MFRRSFIILSLLLAACAGANSAQPSEVNLWNNPYESPKPELCPEDGPAVGKPVFGNVGAYDGVWGGQNLLVQHGLYVNQQDEVFRIDVIGGKQDVIEAYTKDVKICLDLLITDIPSGTPEPGTSSLPSTAPEELGSNPEDLLIEVYPQGYLIPEQSPNITETLKIITSKSPSDWSALFKEHGILLIDEKYPQQYMDNFVLHFIFDPLVSNSGRHQYAEKSVKSIYAKVSVADGSGSVMGGLCRNSSTPLTNGVMTVTKGGTPETASRSDSQSSIYTYDLGVRGNATGRYRISGVWYIPGWSAGYWSAAPTNSTKNCNP